MATVEVISPHFTSYSDSFTSIIISIFVLISKRGVANTISIYGIYIRITRLSVIDELFGKKSMSDLGIQHRKGPHLDHVFATPPLFCLAFRK